MKTYQTPQFMADLLDISQAQTGKDRDTLRDMYGNFSYGQWAGVINFC